MYQIHLALDLARIVLVYVVYGIYGGSYLFMASKILRRNLNRLSSLLGAFYISSGIGVIFNFIYTFIYIEFIVLILYYITVSLLLLSLIFLFLFIFTLKKSEDIVTLRIILGIIIIYLIFVLSICFIPNGVRINESTQWKPVWSLNFTIFVLIIGDLAIIPTIYISFRTYQQFSDTILKKKWKYFLIGILGYFFLFYGNVINLFLNNPLIRQTWSYISILSLPFVYLIYNSIGKSLS
ncbi:MAG: hypothetical protein GF329_02705 [Candidatus Lokiarchaeota archaeon]|nr:hypothetical protein [Candidatus Lokiarchaeota archaeon]